MFIRAELHDEVKYQYRNCGAIQAAKHLRTEMRKGSFVLDLPQIKRVVEYIAAGNGKLTPDGEWVKLA